MIFQNTKSKSDSCKTTLCFCRIFVLFSFEFGLIVVPKRAQENDLQVINKQQQQSVDVLGVFMRLHSWQAGQMCTHSQILLAILLRFLIVHLLGKQGEWVPTFAKTSFSNYADLQFVHNFSHRFFTACWG